MWNWYSSIYFEKFIRLEHIQNFDPLTGNVKKQNQSKGLFIIGYCLSGSWKLKSFIKLTDRALSHYDEVKLFGIIIKNIMNSI